MRNNSEKKIFLAYVLSLSFKFLQSFIEVVVAIFLYFTSTNKITNFVISITHGELLEDPNNFLSNFIIQNATQLTSSAKLFIAFYLLSHGLIKLVILVGIYLKKAWSYPASIIGLGGLIVYQIYHLILRKSVALLILTIMDIIILWLIYHEHRVKSREKFGKEYEVKINF